MRGLGPTRALFLPQFWFPDCDGAAATDGARSGQGDARPPELDDEAAAEPDGDHAQANPGPDGNGNENEK